MLGRTGLRVGVIGLGTEYLFPASRETIGAVVREALENGVNYFDILGPMPGYRDSLGEAFKEVFRTGRDRVVIAGHLGCEVGANGQYSATRDPEKAERVFEDLLRRLGTDYVDIINIATIDGEKLFSEKIVNPGGLADLADRLRRLGKARFVGMSGHTLQTHLAAVKSGRFDSLMYPVNLGPPREEQEQLGKACLEAGVGLVGMKPYKGGEFFQPPYSGFLTPVLALSYALSRPGVAVTVPGAASVAQLRDALAYGKASPAEKDFSGVLADFDSRLAGTCTYCARCLPCAEKVPIDDVMRALRAHQRGSDYGARAVRSLKWANCARPPEFSRESERNGLSRAY